MKMSTMKSVTGMFWAVSLVLASLPLLGYNRYVYEVTKLSGGFTRLPTFRLDLHKFG